jgi:RNA binding exosome subunit
MYIEGFGKAVESEIETRMDDATKYNGRIFELTIDENNKYGSHGDIVKYIDEEVKTLKDMKEVVKALILGLNKEA